LLRKHSTFREFAVDATGFTYPGIRTFYRPHPQEQKLPQKPRPVPLLVFIHGLGGSVAQFNPILISLSNLASCLAIDLPGCGRSSFAPTAWEAYTTEALVQLLAVVIEAHRDRDGGQQVILVGHSMGCSLAAMLASSSSPYAHLISSYVSGLIAICPKADPPTEKQTSQLQKVAALPGVLFDLIRRWDRRGGLNSVSVARMAGHDADEETKRLQLRYNRQSRSKVWQRMAHGMCPDYSTGSPKGGLPGQEVWAGLDLPLFLAAGAADQTTPVVNVRRIVQFLGRDVGAIEPPSEKASLPIAAAPVDPARVDPEVAERKHQDSGVDPGDLPDMEDNTTDRVSSSHYSQDQTSTHTMAISSAGESSVNTDADTGAADSTPNNLPVPWPRRLVVKTAIMPKPAAHSLLFAPTSSRIISGLIGSFLADHIDPRLSLAWQLQYLSTEGKWDVKNFKKWQAVQPVSQPIAGIFRAMKTLREVDEEHSPKIFVRQWAGKLRAVVDISHDSPVYDPKGLEAGGITYYKFPTVSKQPPTTDEVGTFIELIDKIRSEKKDGDQALIGVHCHYGFNRTGFFLVSYLIERLGYRVQDALDTFQEARPPGIRHNHFIDELHVRYFPGLRKAPTM
jgi:pimeloyl-ACP methyl ester carboxylesterase/protein-tyrosine phosphatase